MQLNEIRYEQLKHDAAATSAFKRAGERGENFTLDTSGDATFQLSESLQGKGLLSSRDSFYGKKDLLEEALDNANNADLAAQSDISMKNRMMAKAAKDLSEEDFSESKKEGFDLSTENPYELVTVADKIRRHLGCRDRGSSRGQGGPLEIFRDNGQGRHHQGKRPFYGEKLP